MKIYEILSFNADLLKKLYEIGIDVKDYKSYEIYGEYLKMRSNGYKVSYIVAVLSERFNICNRKVYKIISKMEKDCQISTAG